MGKRRVGSHSSANDLLSAAAAGTGTAAAGASARGTSSSARGNGNLTNHQRKIICEFYHKSGGVMSQKDLAQWTKHEFNLKKPPAQSTISGILRRQHEFINMSSLELGIKKRRVVQHPQLDNALANWVIQCAHRGITVQGDMTKEKAKHFAKMLQIPEDEQPEFSNGWLHSFQLRHNFSFRKFNADNHNNGGGNHAGGSENKKMLSFTTMEVLVNETDKYELHNIFAMEETGILYNLPPIQNAIQENPILAKKRFVAALAVNVDGSERLQPLFVSHHEHPKCFKKKSAEQHGLHYFSNNKAWMTGVIFSRWIQRLDFAMASQKRKILLFINEVASHVVSHLDLTSIVVFLLPSGASQMLNPVTASILSTFKRRYRRHHLRHAIDKSEEGTTFAFDVDVLQAMKWAMASWEEITRDTITRGWAQTHMISANRLAIQNELEDHETALVETELEQLLLFLRLTDPMSLADFLNDEDKCEHPIHEEFFEVVETAEEVPDDEVDDDADDTSGPSLSLQEKLKAFRDVLQVLKDRNDTDDSAMTALRRVQDAIRNEAHNGNDDTVNEMNLTVTNTDSTHDHSLDGLDPGTEVTGVTMASLETEPADMSSSTALLEASTGNDDVSVDASSMLNAEGEFHAVI